jgi:dTDP-4-amino-4,6-dideoxygalactose transaminase
MSEASTSIPQCSPHANYLAHAGTIDAAIGRVLAQGRYILGPEVTSFENEFASYVGVGGAVGVANGTDALELALRALGIGPGDAVVTVSHTAVATIVAIRRTGAMPIFVDVTARDGLIDPVQVESLLIEADRHGLHTPAGRIRAIIPVHLYGRCADLDALSAMARARGLAIVEDCAQAHGAMHGAHRAGSFGAIGAFSFYPTKNLGAMGDGGAVVSDDVVLLERVRLLREYGWRERYVSDIEGGNSRLDEIQAAILREKLPHLDADNAKRGVIADIYRAMLVNPLISVAAANEGHVYHQFTIRCRARDELQAHLRAQAIGSLVHYPRPVHLQPAYSDARYAPLPLPETERWAKEVLSLPMYPELAPELAQRVAAAVNLWTPEG